MSMQTSMNHYTPCIYFYISPNSPETQQRKNIFTSTQHKPRNPANRIVNFQINLDQVRDHDL